MTNQIAYEWKIEVLDEDGDIEDCEHFATLAEARQYAPDADYRICLVKMEIHPVGGEERRGHRYITDDNKWAPEGDYDGWWGVVPQRFTKELAGQ